MKTSADYDEANVISALRERLKAMHEFRGPAVEDFVGKVEQVVLLVSSSRGGSSMVAQLLRQSNHLLHLGGEINPFLRLTGLFYPYSGTGSDALTASSLRDIEPDLRTLLSDEIARDAGCLVSSDTGFDYEQWVLDIGWRIAVQWPDLSLDPMAIAQVARSAVSDLRHRCGWEYAEPLGVERFYRELLARLVGQGIPVNISYYDMPAVRAPAGSGGPGATVVEEPPFVLAVPWHRADEFDVRSKALVIKTPGNAYRLGFLRGLFPKAKFRIIHLTRNPAAAVNGLYDGWMHAGFHAHRMREPLKIPDYIELNSDNCWWWKFDLPPGWGEYMNAALLDVCMFQWRSAHSALIAELADSGLDIMQVRFEDLLAGAGSRVTTFERLSDWLGIPFAGAFRRAVLKGIGPVAATQPPRRGRWRERQAKILPAITPYDQELADRLGYEDRRGWF